MLNAEPGKIGIAGHPICVVMEGPLDGQDGRRVDSRPASGGRSYSESDGGGAFAAELQEPLERGEPAEGHAVKLLIQALRGRGNTVEILAGNRNDRGEDALIIINGQRTPVQIVSVPADQTSWRALSSTGHAARQGDAQDAVNLVREAFVRKKGKATGTILVLDAAHIGAVITGDLPRKYSAAFGDPTKEFSLIEAWIVGPTSRSAVCLGRSSSHLLSNLRLQSTAAGAILSRPG